MRLFAAIFPNQQALKEVFAIQQQLRELLPVKSSWTKPEGMHITLRFFGDYEQVAAEREIGKAVEGVLPFEISLISSAQFARRPYVLYLLPWLCPEMEGIMRSLGEELPQPHLTLARLKQRTPRTHLQFPPIRFTVSEIVLVNSTLAGANSGYEVVRRWAL